MSDYKKARAQIELANEIINGKLHLQQVQKRLRTMKEEYQDSFSSYIPTRRGKPWDVAYLKSLGDSISFGAGSEAQFLYMAEVADEVYGRKRMMKSILLAVGCLATLIALVAIIIRLLGRGN